MRVIIAGGRDRTDPREVEEAMLTAHLFGITPTIVVCGKATGADTLGENWALSRGLTVVVFYAQWRVGGMYDPGAGHKRNGAMAAHADALVAIWDGQSRGTADMIKKARRRGLLVWVHDVAILSRPPTAA